MSNAVRLLQAALQATPPDLTALTAAMRPADWPEFAELVAYHEVAPLIWASLRDYPSHLPPELALHWKERYYLTAVLNDARLSELHAICRDLARHAIRPIVLKGMALAPTVYASIALRAMGDTDLLVRRRDLAVAWAVLSARGYLVPPASARYWQLQFRNAGELRLIQRRTLALVELHWWLCAGTWAEEIGLLSALDPWRRAREATLDDQPALRLHPHDEVLHIAHHLAVSNQFGSGFGRMLVDLDRLIRASPLDWPALLEEARSLRLATILWLALDLARTILDTPISPAYLQLAPPWPQRRLLQRLVRPAALLSGHDPRRRAGRRYLLLLALLDRPRDMWGLLSRGVRELSGSSLAEPVEAK